ncbi:hypothetical protein PAXINDRAFT_104249 [Paxillus involutus ATCC 200175]|uniref:Uncharacterized protein n=1 Tax=Paxillus involutus ATCC 200175 TaxID=664439 RepID=A0A0C9SS63_PAXIN|nr:hypothetical protein PAXINDRAFT_104249 [Paxillus involutus ATCC 200175]
MPKACTALPSTEKAKAKVLVDNGTLERRKSKLQNPNASLHVTKSTTARNLCAIAYKNENKGRTVTSGEYAAYWDGLTAAEKQKWFDQQELCGKAKGAASSRKGKGAGKKMAANDCDTNEAGPSKVVDSVDGFD